ncbi:MAG TPA: 3-isopropylmalate dehydrogenase [Blastocatellia bacterium]|nr:3-isopropylmalate dehydrogenase [Blastocatellia bacterium]
MELNIAVLPGDGVGPEVTREAVSVLEKVASEFGHELVTKECLIGGRALDAFGLPLPKATIDVCLSSDAVLLGAVGGPRYDNHPRGSRPEDGLLGLRRELGGFANLRPVLVHDDLTVASPLKAELVKQCDLLIVRELLGGLYYGTPRGFRRETEGTYRAFNTMSYTVAEIERVAHVAFKAADRRRKKVTSVDKSNVLEVSQLWRKVVSQVANDYPQVELEHMLVDSCAMRLITSPSHFDVLLTENMFGDILSDEAAVIAGSIGMLASASVGGRVNLYEPVHGSAPDIAGEGKANPVGTIASAALLLRYSFGLEAEARAVENAISSAISSGLRTADIAKQTPAISTAEMGEAICRAIKSQRLVAGNG